tara:strand:+ start:399 stop:803 length:405 start_codon:yes stop_codon:yes gene_type:complete
MNYSISIIINLKKNNNITNTYDLVVDIAKNCNTTNIYEDYELNGINNYIKTNNTIIIFDFESSKNIEDFLTIIVSLKSISIEYIFNENIIIYASNKYLNNLSKSLHNKKTIMETIDNNKKNSNYFKIYKLLNVI